MTADSLDMAQTPAKQRGSDEDDHATPSHALPKSAPGPRTLSPGRRTLSARFSSARSPGRSLLRSMSARADRRRQGFSPPPELKPRELKAQRKAERKTRRLFLSAAMPLPSHHADLLAWERAKGSSSSDADSMKGVHVQTEPPTYPWQYRMRVPVRKEGSLDSAEIRRARRLERESQSAAARAGARLAEQRAAAERAAFEKARADAAAREKKKKNQAIAAAIEEAGRVAEAEYSNTFTPIKDTAKLLELKTARETAKKELQAALTTSASEQKGTLTSKLGEAILNCGRTIPQLIQEWDKNNDNSISKSEFKQAIRASLRIEASNPQIENMFQHFDHDGGLTQEQLRQAVRKIFEQHKHVKENEARLRSEVETCSQQIEELTKCSQAAQEWENANARLFELRQIPSISDRLGASMDGKTKGFEEDEVDEVARQWSGDDTGVVGREAFVKQIIMMKNKGDFRIDGNKEAVDKQVDLLFDQLIEALAGKAKSADDADDGEKTLDLVAMLTMLGKNLQSHKAKEKEMQEAVVAAEAKARKLQIEYMREAAKKEKQFELARIASNEEALEENLRKRLEEDAEEARLTAAVTAARDGVVNGKFTPAVPPPTEQATGTGGGGTGGGNRRSSQESVASADGPDHRRNSRESTGSGGSADAEKRRLSRESNADAGRRNSREPAVAAADAANAADVDLAA